MPSDDSVVLPADSLAYLVDQDGIVVGVDDGWRRFALENGAPELAMAPVGLSIWDAISDDDLRELYRKLVRDAWRGRLVDVSIRCDAPDRRRWLELTIAPAAGGVVAFTSRVVREEPRPRLDVLDPGAPRDGRLLTVCSWCARALLDGRWRKVEDAVVGLGLEGAPTQPLLSHGICPECVVAAFGTILD